MCEENANNLEPDYVSKPVRLLRSPLGLFIVFSLLLRMRITFVSSLALENIS